MNTHNLSAKEYFVRALAVLNLAAEAAGGSDMDSDDVDTLARSSDYGAMLDDLRDRVGFDSEAIEEARELLTAFHDSIPSSDGRAELVEAYGPAMDESLAVIRAAEAEGEGARATFAQYAEYAYCLACVLN